MFLNSSTYKNPRELSFIIPNLWATLLAWFWDTVGMSLPPIWYLSWQPKSMILIYKQMWWYFLSLLQTVTEDFQLQMVECGQGVPCSFWLPFILMFQVFLIQSSKIKIGGEKIQLFRVKIKTFSKCQRKRAGLFYFDVNTMSFVVFLFVHFHLLLSTGHQIL